MMNHFSKIQKLNRKMRKLLNIIEKIIKKYGVKDNDFPKNFSADINSIVEHLDARNLFGKTTRSEAIVIFAQMETLRCLYTAYEEKTYQPQKLQDASETSMISFVKKFCLTKENEWFQKNKKRANIISPKSIVQLRNSLTHFFSIKGINLISQHDEEVIKAEKETKHQVKFITTQELQEMLSGAFKLLLKRWNDDCRKGLKNNDRDFIERIECVKKVVEENGAIIKEGHFS